MTHRLRLLCLLPALLLPGLARADLFSYVAKPDDAFKWELKGVTQQPLGKVYDLHLVSQVWEGIRWEHPLQVYEPKQVEFPDIVPLLITGGRPDGDAQALGVAVANLTGMRIAALYQIPNQPLFGGLSEDALISYTWVKYLETGDEDWVCLFPMVKSALRAMDCLDQLGPQQWQSKPKAYLPFGASKRGWTTYLTGIAAPERCAAIAPMVFDILNMPVQIPHQKDFWGSYSEQIDDYTKKGLEEIADTPRGFRLSYMSDPYSYRERLTMPKLIVLGSNDPYWPTDAVNLYFPGLPSPKLLLIAPNSGHGLEDRVRVLGAVSNFFRLVAKGAALPQARWEWTESPAGLTLTVKGVQPKPAQTRLWVARNTVQDFRPAKWEEAPLPAAGEQFVGQVARADGQFTAAYGELVFDVDGRKLYTSTQPRVMGPTPK